MSRRMTSSYFEEKKEYALEALGDAVKSAEAARELIEAARYEMPNIINPVEVHELLLDAQFRLKSARRNYEKTRWADAATPLSFEEWLVSNGHTDLAEK